MEMDTGAIRNFRDFLQLYNKMSEICFSRCVDNINLRTLTDYEIACVDDCSTKFIKFNNKLMQNFVKAQTAIVNKRVEEAEKQQQINYGSTQLEQNTLENNDTTGNQLKEAQVIDGTISSAEHKQSEMVISK